jgi:hypothetical protein
MLFFALIALVTIAFMEGYNTSAIDDKWPTVPDFVENASTEGGTHLDTPQLQWRKVEPDPDNPGQYKPLAGATFILMATQANWNGTQSQQGSQMTVVDNSGADQDKRDGYFEVERAGATEAQDFIYRVWEVNPPSGYMPIGETENKYGYDTPPGAGVKRSGELAYYPNSSFTPDEYIDGWNFGDFVNYPILTTVTWEKVDGKGNHIDGAVFALSSQNGTIFNNIADCTSAPCTAQDTDARAGYFNVQGITSHDFGTITLSERVAPSGYLPITTQVQTTLNEWNTLATFGHIVNQKSPALNWSKTDTDGALIADATFTITTPAGSATPTILVPDCTSAPCNGADTNENEGEFRVTLDAEGTYLVHETTQPTGYELNTETRSVDLKFDDNKNIGAFWNIKYPYVTWAKIDYDTKDATPPTYLPHSEWTLKSPNTPTGDITNITDCAAESMYDCTGIDKDPDVGKFRVAGIDAFGTWSLVETVAPGGYTINSATNTQNIISTNTSVSFGDVTNTKSTPSLLWEKTASDETTHLAGAVFNISGGSTPFASGATVTDYLGETDYKCAENGGATTAICDKDPRAGYFLVIAPSTGDFAISEATAPTGYALNSTQYTVSNASATQQYAFNNGNPITNQAFPLATWNKVDADSAQLLQGSEWTLTQAATTLTVVDNLCPTPSQQNAPCDQDLAIGQVKVQLPSTGVWTLTETKAPVGYHTAQPTQSTSITYDQSYAFGDVENAIILPSVNWHKVNIADASIAGSAWNLTSESGTAISNVTDYQGEAGYSGLDVDPRAGYFKIAAVPFGTWHLSESTAPTGYALAPDAGTSVIILNSDVNETFWNASIGNDDVMLENAIPSEISWQKVDSNDAPVTGAEFALCPGSTTTYNCQDPSAITEIADCTVQFCLEADGSFMLDRDPAIGAYQIHTLQNGEYALIETAVATGFFGTTPNAICSDTLAPGKIFHAGNITNDHYPLVTWTKVMQDPHDSTKTLPIGGAVFSLTNPESATPYTVTDCTSAPCDTSDPIFSKDTDPDTGVFAVYISNNNSQTHPNYTLTETTAPAGFELAAPIVFAPIAANQVQNVGEIVNEPVTPTLSFRKVTDDPDNPGEVMPVGGSTWQLTDPPNIIVVNITDNVGDAGYDGEDLDPRPGYFLIAGFTATEEPLPYVLTETKAPVGYVIDTHGHDIPNVTKDSKINYGDINNNKIRGSLTWEKVDSVTLEPIAGAEFKLTNSSFGVLREEYVADNTGQADYAGVDKDPASGKFLVEDLDMDGWKLEESTAPTGYNPIIGEIATLELTYAHPDQSYGQVTNTLTPPPSPTPSPSPSPNPSTPTPIPTTSPTPTPTPSPEPPATQTNGTCSSPEYLDDISCKSNGYTWTPDPKKPRGGYCTDPTLTSITSCTRNGHKWIPLSEPIPNTGVWLPWIIQLIVNS